MTDPSEPLRQLAQIVRTPGAARALSEFAERLESQHNQQNNNWQAALGMTDLHFTAAIDQLRNELSARLDASEQWQVSATADRADLREKLIELATLAEQIRAHLQALGRALEVGGDASGPG